jgi:hypothetical protein
MWQSVKGASAVGAGIAMALIGVFGMIGLAIFYGVKDQVNTTGWDALVLTLIGFLAVFIAIGLIILVVKATGIRIDMD